MPKFYPGEKRFEREELAIARQLCHNMRELGWRPIRFVTDDRADKITTADHVRDALLDYGRGSICFENTDGNRIFAFLVMGNGPDAISDYTVNRDLTEAIEATMEGRDVSPPR